MDRTWAIGKAPTVSSNLKEERTLAQVGARTLVVGGLRQTVHPRNTHGQTSAAGRSEVSMVRHLGLTAVSAA
jgi:hypothetical protein